MMYRGAIVLAVILMACAVVAVVMAWRARRQRRWEIALQNPSWEVSETTFGGRTDVCTALVARDGRRHKVYRESPIGHVDIADSDWSIELEILRGNAKQLVAVLNEGRSHHGQR